MKRRAISLMLIILFMLQEVSAYAPAESERVVTSNTETARSFYTVRFLVEEGDAPAARFYDAQSAPTFGSLPAAPSVDGEVFTGWFLPDSDEPVDAGTVVPGDTTLVARYEPVAAREAGAGDAQADAVTLLYDSALIAEGSPVADGAKFSKLVAELMLK